MPSYTKLKRWEAVVIIATFCSILPYGGILASYGVILTSVISEFETTSLTAGWAGSLAFGFTVGTCPVSTALYAKFGAKKLCVVGIFGAVASLVATSFVTNIYLMFLTYSVCLGISCNFMYNSYMNLLGDCFQKENLAFASCIASCGLSVGTLTFNPLATFLTSRYGWRNELRIFAGLLFVMTTTSLLSLPKITFISSTDPKELPKNKRKEVYNIVYKKVEETYTFSKKETAKDGDDNDDDLSLDEQKYGLNRGNVSTATFLASKFSMAMRELKEAVFSRKMFDFHMCSNFSFWLWMIGTFAWSVALLFPNIFLVDYQERMGVPNEKTAIPLILLGIGDLVGRMLAALTADRIPFSTAYVYSICSLVGGIMAAVTPTWKNIAMVYLYVLIVGVSVGVMNSLIFAATIELFGKRDGFYAWGYVNVMLAAGMVAGPVIAGGLFDASNSYDLAFYTAGGFLILSSVLMCLIPVCKKKFPLVDAEEVEIAKSNVKKLPHKPPMIRIGSCVHIEPLETINEESTMEMSMG